VAGEHGIESSKSALQRFRTVLRAEIAPREIAQLVAALDGRAGLLVEAARGDMALGQSAAPGDRLDFTAVRNTVLRLADLRRGESGDVRQIRE